MRLYIDLAGRRVGPGESTFLIGEVGVNHNGDPAVAEKLIDAAAECGLDAVKFQSFKAESLVLEGTGKAEYQRETTGHEKDQYQMLKSLELSAGTMAELKSYSEERGLLFLSTPYDPESARELIEMGIAALKISSADLVDALLLMEAARGGVPLLLSVGMSENDDIDSAVALLEREGCTDVILLHCVSMYPAPAEVINLSRIAALSDRYGKPVGFSDHTPGTETAALAVAAGACLVEKHFTLDRNMEGPDHRASLEPDQMKKMARSVRNVEVMMGKPCGARPPEEKANAALMRKSLVYQDNLPEGTVLKISHLAAKRPASGLSPMEYASVVGKKLKRDVGADEQVRKEDF